MNSRIGTNFKGIFLTAQDLNGGCISNISWDGPGNAPYEFIRTLNMPCQITASYTLEFYDRFARFPQQNVIHSVKREIKFWVVPNDKQTAKENIALIKQKIKKQKLPYKDILVIDTRAYGVYPKKTYSLPGTLYKYFNNIYGEER